MPKVSIIVPTYNVAEYLDQCMTSLINQTLKDIEIIAINDGSTDNSLEILKRYAEKDSRIKIIDKENGGYGIGMNIGLDNCTGDYVGILEPDDYVKTSMYGDLYELAEKCVNMLQINAEKQNVTLMLTGKSTRMMANREMMEELLYNLVSNAIRYNRPYGNVVVSVNREEEQVHLTVEDTGIGISQADQERVFERFYRVDKSRSKSTGGTGLGLAIVKHVVQCHGAKLNMQSQLGAGTRIDVIF